MIYTGDCLDVMRTLPSESVDAVVTDPPAGISFMSRNWDHDKGGRTQWVGWMTEVMVECHRLLKPGGYAVVWSLPRTCHWTAWAMEDAGFIIRDQPAHIFASGFPKGKAQLKPAREDWWLARKPGPLQPLNIEETRIPGAVNGWEEPRGGIWSTDSDAKADLVKREGRWPSNLLLSDPELFDEPNPWVVGSGATVDGATSFSRAKGKGIFDPGDQPLQAGYGDSGGYSRFFTVPTPAACVHGIPFDQPCSLCYRPTENAPAMDEGVGSTGNPSPVQPDYPTAYLIPKASREDREPVLGGEKAMHMPTNFGPKNQGSLPQQTPVKPSLRGNSHPTVKPTDLMRHLIRLVTPAGGTVLDCFAGSGSTLIAAELEGFPWIGIEQSAEYVAIAEARLNGTQRGLGLDVPAPTRKRSPQTGMGKPGAAAPTYKGDFRNSRRRLDGEEPAA